MLPRCLLFLGLLLAGSFAADMPDAYTGMLSLVRYDQPVGRSDGFAPTRQLAQRQGGQDAVDWPEITFNGAPLFRTASEERLPLPLRADASPFTVKGDHQLSPGGHWFRPLQNREGRRYLYTTDPTARAGRPNETTTGKLELWTFPVAIHADGAPVKIIVLKSAGRVIFRQDGPWRSLTLLLPASAPGEPYELSVDSRPPVKFNVGLLPAKAGQPREKLAPVDLTIGGDGPVIHVQNLVRGGPFPHPREWAADVAELGKYAAVPIRCEPPAGMRRYLGLEVPRSPFLIYAAQLPFGLSGGFYRQAPAPFTGSAEEYGAMLAEQGFDAVFDQAGSLPKPEDAESIERRATALLPLGLKLGLQYDQTSDRPSLGHVQTSLYAHTLPEWHAPLYRSLSLAAQRLGRLPNFLGFNIGAGTDAYASGDRDDRPSPSRPWGEAMESLLGTAQPKVPRPPGAGAGEEAYEFEAKSTQDFLKYVQRFDASFQQYGYFAEAVRQANPRLVFTTAAFGSGAARGGWSRGSVPGRLIFEGLNVLQAYDLNRARAAKPLHNVALTDRLRSYYPKTPAWSLIDNNQLLYGREAYQRACALALTRGITGLGTNFLASPTGPSAQPEIAAFQKEIHAWIHQFGGVFARTEPLATIGIYYGHQEAVQRPVIGGATPPEAQLYGASHEGKVTEALFLCHAAGWPARVLSYQEIKRGDLPPSMQAILLVGVKAADESWSSGHGLEGALKVFTERGGRILADDESTWPGTITKTTLRLAGYQPQSPLDPTPLLFARNRGNIATLRAAMEGAPPPVATSSAPTLWAIPTRCGDVEYVTALNQAYAEGEEAAEFLLPPKPGATTPEQWKTKGNASRFVKGQAGQLDWHTTRPIYDLRLGRKLAADEATRVDLTKDAFQWYALPPAEPVAPKVAINKRADGFYQAVATIANPEPMRGVPIAVQIAQGDDRADLQGVSGYPLVLPVHERDAAIKYQVTVTERLSGLSTTAEFTSVSKPVTEPPNDALKKFTERKGTPLVIALTGEQAKDPALAAQADSLVAFYRAKGRTASRGLAEPGGVVESLQPLKSPHRFPQWKTAAVDLVLLGTPANNVLLLDQLRGEIWPLNFRVPKPGENTIFYSRSPFVGECDAISLIAPDTAGLTAAVRALLQP